MTSDFNTIHPLSGLLPRLVRQRLEARGARPTSPSAGGLEGVLLWADVIGFTPLVERLSGDGSTGAERLSEALGGYFGRLIEIVESEGGDLQFLAGDGALSLWRTPAPDQPGGEAGLEGTFARALAAARKIVSELDGYRPQRDIPIRLRATLSAGPLVAATVGGVDGRWLDLIAGRAVCELGASATTSMPGFLTTVGGVTAARTISLTPSAARLAAAATAADRHAPAAATPRSPAPPSPPVIDVAALVPHVLPSLASRILAGQLDFLAEFRSVTVVFVDLSALGDEPELARLQEVVAIVQETLADWGGAIHQLLQDDKGINLVAVFGLPGGSHDDDPVRGARFARHLSERLRPLLGPRISCGVSTGPVFSGPCGLPLPRRCQYALFGRPMTRAARLMHAADGAALIDEETGRHVARRLALGAPLQLSLKGVEGPLTAYAADDLGGPASDEPPSSPTHLVGRRQERRLLARKVDALAQRGRGGVVIIEGPAGIGKTALLADLARGRPGDGVRVAWGAADLVESRTPFFARRAILRAVLAPSAAAGTALAAGGDELERRAAATLEALGESVELLPLLAQPLGHPIADSPRALQMAPAVRAENRNRLLLALVELAGRRGRWVVILDDLHWSDAASAALLPHLVDIPGFLWILASRPDGAAAELLGTLVERHAAPGIRLTLGGLPDSEVAALAEITLGADIIPPVLAALLVERAQGNPLYSRELALVLRETRRILVTPDGRCVLAPSFRPELARELPTSLSALIKSRIDLLPPEPRLTLRVASVIGQTFERQVLAAVLDMSAARLDTAIAALVDEGFLHASGDGQTFAFSHATVQAVAYELFPERQRSLLHKATAEALERVLGADSPAAYGRLSHHWTEAGEAPKATDYSARAARLALDGYANRDAIDLFRRALDNQEIWRGRRPIDVERARLFAGKAQAHYSSTEPREARAAFQAALTEVGLAEPGGRGGVLAGIARYLIGKPLRRRRAPVTGELHERNLAALEILAEWITLDFWEGRLQEGAAKAFLGHRLAASVLDSPLAADAIARLGYVLAVTPLRIWAEGELRTAAELADRIGDLQAIASSRVLLGMYYTLDGRPAQALGPLQEAQAPAEALGSGLWRHRTRFQLGETLFCLGRFEEARGMFARAAALSTGAEPPVVGLATSMSALAVARLANLGDAMALLDGPNGLPLIAGRFLPLQRYIGLGIKAEVLARLGRFDEALAVAREAEDIAAEGDGEPCDVFFAGLHGHAGVAETYLALWTEEGSAFALRAEAQRACQRLKRFAGLYPAARPRADLLAGRWWALAGRPRAAHRLLSRALAAATKMQMPYERALAEEWLRAAAFYSGPHPVIRVEEGGR